MSNIPRQELTVLSNGLGVAGETSERTIFLGACESGTVSAVNSHTRITDAVTTLGQGPLSEAVCYALQEGGGPVYSMRLTGTVAATAGAVTPARVGSSTGTVTVAGTPLDGYEVIIEILTTGAIADGPLFRYSLDDGYTYSAPIVVPSGASYVLPSTGLTITFVDGAGPTEFEDGDTHSFDCTPPYYSTTELGVAVTAILAQTTRFDNIILVGVPATAAAGATMFGALEGHMATLFAQNRFALGVMNFGSEAVAATQTSLAGVEDEYVAPFYSTADVTTAKPIAGWGVPKIGTEVLAGARIHKSLISTDLARVISGSLNGVQAVAHDEYLNESLDAHRIGTLRTWLGRPGFYFTNGRLKSAAGSDFRYIQHRRVMNTACRTVYLVQQEFVSAGIRTNDDGSIDERDAIRLETKVENALRAQLTDPANAEGTQGHVSEFSYVIDRANNINTSEQLLSTVAIRPLGYPKVISTTLGFALNVGEAS